MLRVSYPGTPGESFYFGVERCADGAKLDFSATPPAFVVPPTNPKQATQPLGSDPVFQGRFTATLPTVGWPDGDYCVIVATSTNMVLQQIPATIYHGDDAAPDWAALAGQAAAQAMAKAFQALANPTTPTGG